MVDLKISLPDNFLNEEVRDGYLVTSERKQLWAVLLDLLNQVDIICKKHNISYFLSDGTLLGAVRHKGFIPWDDDLDIMMKRNEYNRFCEIAPTELGHPYFFQTEKTDPGHLLRHAKVRNSETTGMFKHFYKKGYKINQGIFIDIFPLDNLPDNLNERKEYCSNLYNLWGKVWKLSAYKNRNIRFGHMENIKLAVVNYLLSCLKKENYYNELFEKLISKYKDVETEYCCSIIGYLTPKGLKNNNLWKSEVFKDFILCDFEFFKMPIPLSYDSYLRTVYGDWKQFVIGVSGHGEIIVDLNKSYLHYK